MRSSFLIPALILVVMLSPAVPRASADKGGIPLDPEVTFDESAQNAIAAWNGTEEVLLLSTDVRSERAGRLLEMLPLPSSPIEVQEGNVSSFRTMVGLFNQKAERLNVLRQSQTLKGAAIASSVTPSFEGVSITFLTSVGLHDITVVRVENQTHFVEWVNAFARERDVSALNLSAGLNATIQDHLSRGICYFAFDVIDLAGDLRTATPLQYRFRTDFLYYPLAVTRDTLPITSWMYHQINLFLLMNGVHGGHPYEIGGLETGRGFGEYIEFSRSELKRVSRGMASLFPGGAFCCHLHHEAGEILYPSHLSDITISRNDIRRPTPEELREQYFRADYLNFARKLGPSIAGLLLTEAINVEQGWDAWTLVFIFLCMLAAPFGFGALHRDIIGRRENRSLHRRGALIVYAGGMLVLVFMLNLGGLSTRLNPVILPVILVAFTVPLAISLHLGNRLPEEGESYPRRRVRAAAYGLGTLQVLTLIFLPDQLAAVSAAVFCLPAAAILALGSLYPVVAGALKRRRRTEGSGGAHDARPPSG